MKLQFRLRHFRNRAKVNFDYYQPNVEVYRSPVATGADCSGLDRTI